MNKTRSIRSPDAGQRPESGDRHAYPGFRGLRFWLCLLFLFLSPVTYAAGPDIAGTAREMIVLGDSAARNYAPDRAEAGAAAFSSLYFDVFEARGLELSLGARDRETMLRLEGRFAKVIQTAIKARPKAELQRAWEDLRGDLESTAVKYRDRSSGAGEAFSQSLLILLREGAEAILVVAALAAFMRRSGQTRRLPFLWGGVAAALAASLATAWAISELLDLAGARRGMLEGGVILIAAGMMAYVAAWLFARREAQRWNDYLKAQLADGGRDHTPWTAAIVAFLAVYREGAETTLFYQALIQSAPGQGGAILGGAGVAVLVLAALFAGVALLGARLPFKPFFTATAALLFFLAVTFTGKGVMELQMAGVLPASDLHGLPSLSWLGLYPTLEGLGGQLALVAAALLLASRFKVHTLRHHEPGSRT
jgi:high-affinity iron transporter